MATPISIRLPDELRDLVERRATDEHRSLNAQIISLLELALGMKRASTLSSPPGSGRSTFRGTDFKKEPEPKKKRR